jgi:hypothetical protein
MLRRILIASVLSLGFFSPFVLPAVSEAREVVRYPQHRHYRVYYRECSHERWRLAGSYHYREDAFREARFLRHRGFEVMVR